MLANSDRFRRHLVVNCLLCIWKSKQWPVHCDLLRTMVEGFDLRCSSRELCGNICPGLVDRQLRCYQIQEKMLPSGKLNDIM